ncbi:dTMP kinase [Streptomyces sp. NPDC019224]|uniref:dTMP kinase n=1 Tax=Streptomyces sp. NPDC019224 TaxID=3154484 RepID=UPI00340EB0EC
MTGTRPGRFITLDGPGGVGKSTTAGAVARLLAAHGEQVHSTKEPSGSPLGQFIRANADDYDGAALACLVVADRHHHLAREIVPRLTAGDTVVCDRYIASTLVVQALDGVPQRYLLDLNAGLRLPDLAVILTADPRAIAARIAERGATHRFNRDASFPAREVALYDRAAELLRAMGVPVLVLDTGAASPTVIAEQIASAAFGLGSVSNHLNSAPASTQGATPA